MVSIKKIVLATLSAVIVSAPLQFHSALAKPKELTDDLTPSTAYVMINNQKTEMVVNGYELPRIVADGAYHPVRNLKPIPATTGSNAVLLFHQPPTSLEYSMWHHGKQTVNFQALNSGTFALPTKPGVYIHEILANWGEHQVIQYDFAVRIQE